MKQMSGMRMRGVAFCAGCSSELPAFRHWLTRYCQTCRPSHSKKALKRIEPLTEQKQVKS
ncbi:hypothetical protein [Burkholderia stabilis]|uniref:Uncharacterized protein n=1 Tax=Burkholderia stabilis TaxID=95485 RepID=A0AAJ5NEF6_9BURK|nr:hypothetical protein [Burkholderia stabilis]VBB13384.1 hypothetical protein BSTAB16_3569 [Burkholderia stabilis]